jgi:hypothetical protein
MNLSKYIIHPLDTYLNNWFNSLPFQALERIFGVSLKGLDWEAVLYELGEEWEIMDIEEKVSYHDQWWESFEGWTSHLIPPSLYIPYRDIEF